MEGLKIMMFDEVSDHKIRYRIISEWFKSIQMTVDIYSHLIPNSNRDAQIH